MFRLSASQMPQWQRNMFNAMVNLAQIMRNSTHRDGAGRRTLHGEHGRQSRYTGEMLRQCRAAHGVGRPPMVYLARRAGIRARRKLYRDDDKG